MEKAVLRLFVLAALFAATWAVDGVKGGGHKPRYPSTSNTQYGSYNSTDTNNLCYRTVPYSHAAELNSTGIPHNTMPPMGNNEGWVTILACCEGYSSNPVTGKCEPVCENGCLGGQCTAPNVCTCQPGWSMNPAYPGACTPVCERPCQPNAYCFAPNVCYCQLGYDDVNGECKPICPGGCRNGECVAPRVCRCNPGFSLNQLQECIPTYECSPGYTRDVNGRCSIVPESTTMRPMNQQGQDCPRGCGLGTCVGPNRCVCADGTYKDPDTGRCYAPAYPNPSRTECNPPCGQHANCTPGNTCVCMEGYQLNWNTGQCVPESRQNMEPICELPCLNGDCTGPNQCTCKHGYTLDARDPTRTRCVPVCLGGCPNGVCTAPNFCLCNPGYAKDTSVKSRARCVPVQSYR